MIPTKAELELSRWRERAACRGVDLAVFIPVAHHEASEAKAICSGCPVWKECALAACYEGDDFAVRGGMHPQARRKWARRLGLRVGRPAVAVCGTDSGYFRHRTRGEEPCPDCRAAHAAKQRDWSRRAREAS